jgi:hypothetical protein
MHDAVHVDPQSPRRQAASAESGVVEPVPRIKLVGWSLHSFASFPLPETGVMFLLKSPYLFASTPLLSNSSFGKEPRLSGVIRRFGGCCSRAGTAAAGH